MSKGRLKVAFDQRDGAETASCSSTETEMPEANVSLQANSALSSHSHSCGPDSASIALAPATGLGLTAARLAAQALSALELCAEAFEDLEAETAAEVLSLSDTIEGVFAKTPRVRSGEPEFDP